ncbi:DEAD/DEAH box helicase family protein [uncultured Hyphomonas sp.]|uniref:DEAD/DEAH box helicase n=1 Tax=uncultured Hyphomonas sp. TaxID=225298 RepID=UPI000C65BA78|nr:restriction endonuclease subunit R [Hyphomonadaceae bacterium]MBA29098.1 restriction endonuclease subunit R [Hyphomonadaceae bacterium]|tara:strand:+ start:5817 stop:8471 length:2655 start_codon:yes stop_codon:yes gene_type:complete
MAAVNFELRSYQQDALDALQGYLSDVPTMGARTAFISAANMLYTPAPFLNEDAPYVCIRIPTGGGKTIVAAHSIGVAAKAYLHTDSPMVLWLVPSKAILNQTLDALRDLDHPYRAALAADFGRNLTVLTVEEALSLSRPDASGGACIIVSTLQAFRVEETDGRKVYQDAGALMDHFSGLNEEQIARLEKVDGTHRPVASLANVLKLHRPMIIVDEAHNNQTALSFDTLSRFDPSLILEMTATPQAKIDPAKNLYPSNVLYHVSAAELKAAEMIKLPIRLQTDADWKKVIGQAYDCREALENEAKEEQAETGEYIRPIILFQAQSQSKTDPDRLTIDKVTEYLTETMRIPREQIALHGGGYKELDSLDDVADPSCDVRYVITIQALREGWDCPFAYVLCSVGELKSATAVEQILGRVLRMPQARRKTRDTLNRAYAFVASKNFNDTAGNLKDGLVVGAGFDRLEAEELVKAHSGFQFSEERGDYQHESDAIPDTPDSKPADVINAIQKLPPSIRNKVEFDPESRKLKVTGVVSRDQRNTMLMTFNKVPGAEKAVESLFIRSNRIQASELIQGDKLPFIVPQLCIYRQDELELLSRDHFLDLPWNLADCDPANFVDRYRIKDASTVGLIDTSNEGRMTVAFVGDVQEQLSMLVHEPAWTLPRLVNWIDRGIPHPDVTKPAAKVFISNALEGLMRRKNYALDELARYRAELRRALKEEIDKLRKEREAGSYDALFAADAQKFETAADKAIVFDAQNYAYNQPYRGGHKFQKHYFQEIGDLNETGEEFQCAQYLDNHKDVRYWVRNVDRKPNAFWLQLPSGKFYPDFVALLTDGRVMAVEYKGAHLMAESRDKLRIGELWADASAGKCLFVIPTDRNFAVIDDAIKGV